MTPLPPDRIRAHLVERGPIGADVHAVADTAWDLLSSGLLDLPLPGSGETIMRWWALVEIAAVDVAVARLVENHLEAQAIHAEVGRALPDGLWAVWSDDTGDSRVSAESVDGGWQLSGTRRWCAGARSVTRALVTTNAHDGIRLFSLPTRGPAVRFDPDSGPAVGMALADPLQMTLENTLLPAEAEIGSGANWYLDRAGYWATAAGTAALWYGGCLGVAREVRAVVQRNETDPFGLAHLGFADALCGAMEATLARAARVVDSGEHAVTRTAAWQTRAIIEHLATTLIRDAGQVLGPDVLATDDSLSRRIADLNVDLRRHTGEREYAALGADVIDNERLV